LDFKSPEKHMQTFKRTNLKWNKKKIINGIIPMCFFNQRDRGRNIWIQAVLCNLGHFNPHRYFRTSSLDNPDDREIDHEVNCSPDRRLGPTLSSQSKRAWKRANMLVPRACTWVRVRGGNVLTYLWTDDRGPLSRPVGPCLRHR
jgi:hypothetical protein